MSQLAVGAARASAPQLPAQSLRATISGRGRSRPRHGWAPVTAAAVGGRPPRGGGPVPAAASVPQPLVAQKCSPCEPADPLEFMGFCTVRRTARHEMRKHGDMRLALRRNRGKDTPRRPCRGLPRCSPWIAAPQRPICSRYAALGFRFGFRLVREHN